MLSAIGFNLDQYVILPSGIGLSYLEADSVHCKVKSRNVCTTFEMKYHC